MNDILKQAAEWFLSLGIDVDPRQDFVIVPRNMVETLGTPDEVLKELRSALGTNKLYWSKWDDHRDKEWLKLECF
jgi:hypothetical protein